MSIIRALYTGGGGFIRGEGTMGKRARMDGRYINHQKGRSTSEENNCFQTSVCFRLSSLLGNQTHSDKEEKQNNP